MAKSKAQRCRQCCGNVFTLFVYILEYIVPSLAIILLNLLFNTYDVTRIVLGTSTSLLALFWFVIGMKFWTDYEWYRVEKDRTWFSMGSKYHYNEVWCPNPTKFGNLLHAGHLMYPLIPWTIVNMGFIIAWTVQLQKNDLWIILLSTVGIAYFFAEGVILGHCIVKKQKKYEPKSEEFDCCYRTKRFFSITLYITAISIPIFFVAVPIMTWNNYNTAWFTILIHAILLTIMAFIVPIKIWIDCTKDVVQSEITKHYGDHFSTDPGKFKSLISGTFLLIFTCPWYFLINVVCMAVWGQTLVDNKASWLIGFSLGAPVLMALIGTACGYGIVSIFYDEDDD